MSDTWTTQISKEIKLETVLFRKEVSFFLSNSYWSIRNDGVAAAIETLEKRQNRTVLTKNQFVSFTFTDQILVISISKTDVDGGFSKDASLNFNQVEDFIEVLKSVKDFPEALT